VKPTALGSCAQRTIASCSVYIPFSMSFPAPSAPCLHARKRLIGMSVDTPNKPLRNKTKIARENNKDRLFDDRTGG
jgi:hypothetical protein